MTEARDQLLLRSLAGELSPGQEDELSESLVRDPALRRRQRRLAALWQGLEPPSASPVPPFFAARVAARVEDGPMMTWRRAPVWARAAAAAALLAGLLIGGGLGLEADRLETPLTLSAETSALADEYWALLAALDDNGPGVRP